MSAENLSLGIRNSIKNQIQKYVLQEQLTESQAQYFAQIMNRWVFDNLVSAQNVKENKLKNPFKEIQPQYFKDTFREVLVRISQRLPEFFTENQSEIMNSENFHLILQKKESYSGLVNELYPAIRKLGELDGDLFGQLYSYWIAPHRKNHGQFYTPHLICEYMINRSLELKWNPWWHRFKNAINQKNHAQITICLNEFYQWRVLDPACGAGAFLIAALILFWDYYLKIETELMAFQEFYFPIQDMGRIRLIFMRHLYGMDMNANALENTAMNLVWTGIKWSADYNIYPIFVSLNLGLSDTLNANKPEKLQEMGNFIQDSLQILRQLQEKVMQNQTNPNDWQRILSEKQRIRTILHEINPIVTVENLPSSFKSYDNQIEVHFWFVFYDEQGKLKPVSTRGFDLIVGNPPYERAKQITQWKTFYRKRYSTVKGACDIFIPFFERVHELLQQEGIANLITSNKYLVADYGRNLRELLLQQKIIELTDLTEVSRIFSDAFISPLITCWQKCPPPADHQTKIHLITKNNPELLLHLNQNINSRLEHDGIISHLRQQTMLRESSSGHINLYFKPHIEVIMKKITKDSVPLKNVVELRTGIMGFNYHAMEQLMNEKPGETALELIPPSLVQPYNVIWGKKSVHLYGKNFSQPKLRFDSKYINTQTWEFFTKPKIIIRGIATRLTAAYDEQGRALLVAVHGAISKTISPHYIIGILNSSLFNWIHRTMMYTARIPRGSLRYPISFLERLPIKINAKKMNFVINLVQKMEQKQKKDLSADISKEQSDLDAIIYTIYGINSEEIQIISQESQK